MTMDTQEPPPALTSRRDAVAQAMNALARLANARPGIVTAIRRMEDPSEPPLAFFMAATPSLDRYLRPGTPDEERTTAEMRWAIVFWTIAQAQFKGLAGTTRLGAAMARAKIAEQRVVRLLEARDLQVAPAVRAVVAPLMSRAESFLIDDVAGLVLPDPTSDEGEMARRRIARDYYRNQD